jgi:predicted RND superfamily exporter protein
LPRDQPDKLRALARLRALVDRELERHGDLLADDERARLRAARPPDDLRAVSPDDLPRAVREAFTEVDGTRGRLVGIDADGTRYHDWDGHVLLALAASLAVEHQGRHYVAASAATVFAGMLETLIGDAPRLATYALLAVAAILVVIFRGGVLPVLAALALGLLWLVGAAGVLDLRLNFMSFAAIPISVGVGADYAANVWSRRCARRHDAAIGPVVVLCSLTTIIGYSSLLLGRNGALRSFGVLCDVGEVTCLLAALLSTTVLGGAPRRVA